MTPPSTSPNQSHQSGLDHLVEAATALTQLVRTASVPKMNQQDTTSSKSHEVSDDEDTKSKQASVASNTSLKPTSNKGNSEQIQPLPHPFKRSADNAKEIFPRRLFMILSDTSISDIITWLPHGRAFVILKTDELADTVLPKYFPESCAPAQSPNKPTRNTCKYPSFTRKLNRWGFRQVTRGADSGAFHHKFFNREEPDLCLKMVCQRSKRRKGDKNTTVRNAALKPAASQILGPYSAALRQQPIESPRKNTSKGPTLMNSSDGDSDSSANNSTSAVYMFSTGRNQEDQATIVSSRSCTTPPPNMNRGNNSSVTSLLSPSLATANNSPVNQMVRTVSTTSSVAPLSNMNGSNMQFQTIFSNNGAPTQVDPRLLLQRNMTATASAPDTLNQAFARAIMPQIAQNPTMPNFISFLDKKSVNSKTQQGMSQVNSQQHQQQTSSMNTQNMNKFATPLVSVPVAAIAPAITAPPMATSASISSNSTVSSSISGISSNTQSQQQTEAQLRVANARNMLYNAFLQALG